MTIEALLLLVTGFSGTLLIASNTTPYFSHGGALLHILLLPYLTWIAFILIGAFRKKPERLQFITVVIYSLVLLGLIFLRQELARGPQDQPVGVHDGAVQTEVAGDLLLHGTNPYTADYAHTAYAVATPPIPENPGTNVVWSHFIYFPLPVLLQSIWQIVARALQVFPDARIWYYLALITIGFFLVTHVATYRKKTITWLLTVGNPLVWLYVTAGANDILPTLGMVAAALALMKRRWAWAGIAFGLALAAKQSTWILLPLWCMWLWILYRRGQSQTIRITLPVTVATAAVIIVPFFAWNPSAFINDTVTYASGSILYAYPISGTTFLQYLHVFHWIPSPWTIIPTYLYELAIGVPMSIVTALWLKKQPTAATWLSGSAVVLLSTLLFSRYYNNNYTLMVIILAVAAYALTPKLQPTNAHVAKNSS